MSKQANQEKALTALLSTPTIAEAAKSAGLSVDTVYRYLADHGFKQVYRERRRQIMEASAGRIQQCTDAAIVTLRRNLRCGIPAAENAAAKILIETATKSIELVDLLERVEAIENAQSE